MVCRCRFQSTRPRGRTRLTMPILANRSVRFNPRVLAGGRDHPLMQIIGNDLSFNPRVLAGGRDLSQKRLCCQDRFQSTRPRGRTRHRLPAVIPVSACFNPRVLAGGRDLRMPSEPHQLVFQSTRPRGRTRPSNSAGSSFTRSFNPRVLAGGRDSSATIPVTVTVVSIHASSREDATMLELPFLFY